jgi:hypothetical protein
MVSLSGRWVSPRIGGMGNLCMRPRSFSEFLLAPVDVTASSRNIMSSHVGRSFATAPGWDFLFAARLSS